ncbi:glycosyltransferase family 39 protein [Polaromonas sp. AET17H-212]|uniref:glycosyltransferase family 39 protein n=1 Tax=Polaromonas sp. AET17H-212 TaxID=1977061 RepID=UPI001142621E|nr:glycosyltransferase family 39 protein [Polaromonas sp. AET17H-212]
MGCNQEVARDNNGQSLSGRNINIKVLVGIILNITGRAKDSAVFLLYCGLLAALFYSVTVESGSRNTDYLLTYAGSLLVSYLLFSRLLGLRGSSSGASKPAAGSRLTRIADRLANGLLAGCVIFIVLHFSYLGHVPVLAGIASNDYFDIMRIRQSVFFEAPAVFRYLPNIILKSLLPFLLLYYCVTGRRRAFLVALGVGTFYGVALMNKMFVVILYAPLILYLLFSRRFLFAAGMALIPVAALALLVFVQNPQVRPELWTPRDKATASGKPLIVEAPTIAEAIAPRDKATASGKPLIVEAPTIAEAIAARKKTQSSSYPLVQFVETIYLRIFVVPGQVVAVWFSNIPSRLPFANGCGYRFVAAIRGCEFQFYPSLVHDIENPILVREGVRGTMTAASFMEDYANFGFKGLVLSGALFAFLLAFIARMFSGDWRWALILNFIPIAMMIELPLSTVLLTGGWAVTLLLYLIFRDRLKTAGETKEA